MADLTNEECLRRMYSYCSVDTLQKALNMAKAEMNSKMSIQDAQGKSEAALKVKVLTDVIMQREILGAERITNGNEDSNSL